MPDNRFSASPSRVADASPGWRYGFRAVETNEPMHWNGAWLDDVLGMMRARGFNVLVVHQNDLLDALSHLEPAHTAGVSDLRRKIVYSRVAWMRELSRKLSRQGASLFLEVKEPSFADYILSLFPDAVDEAGKADPARPVWEEIVRAKVRSVLASLPELGGLIVSLSTPEARVMPKTAAAGFDFAAWMERMVEAIRGPLTDAGKDLILRDFTYGTDLHDATVRVLNRVRPSTSASIKISPCDYFPGFPNNETAHSLTNVPILVEFEAFGENTGWGVVPNCRVAELAERMRFVDEIGAIGTMVRLNWEGVLGWSALEATSDVNVAALSRLMERGDPASPEDIVSGWLQGRYGVPADAPETSDIARLLLDSSDCVAAIYWHDNVFPRHSQIPLSWQQGWWSMQGHAVSDWSRNSDHLRDFDLTDENRDRLFAAKARALEKARALAGNAARLLSEPALPCAMVEELGLAFANLPVFVQAFEIATRGAFFAARFDAGGDPEDRRRSHAVAQELEDLVAAFQQRAEAAAGTAMAHVSGVMFAPDHLRSFAASLRAV